MLYLLHSQLVWLVLSITQYVNVYSGRVVVESDIETEGDYC